MKYLLFVLLLLVVCVTAQYEKELFCMSSCSVSRNEVGSCSVCFDPQANNNNRQLMNAIIEVLDGTLNYSSFNLRLAIVKAIASRSVNPINTFKYNVAVRANSTQDSSSTTIMPNYGYAIIMPLIIGACFLI